MDGLTLPNTTRARTLKPMEPFLAPWWARGPHAQTLLARWLRSEDGPDFERERLETSDDDFIDLDWTFDPGEGAPIVLLLHGLEGSSDRRYMRNVARELLQRGVRAVAMNFRGCSGEPNRQLRFYHSGETADPGLVLKAIRERFPDRRLGAMGFSLGGNMILKAMGERDDGGTGMLDACVAMSVPYDLSAGCSLLERSVMGRVYSDYFMRSLRQKVSTKRDRLAEVLDMDQVDGARTIRAFDEAVTAPLNDFDDAEDYYRRCSSAPFLTEVRVPTLLLHARNDPFLPADLITEARAAANLHIRMVTTDYGGHVGFIQGSLRKPDFWGDRAGAAFLADALG
jgi:predicted alpha/beta-fold hydrolase